MSIKTCSKCSRDLPATTEFFSPNPTGTFGLYSICRKCKQPIDCERRKTRDKKKELEQKKEYYHKDRDRLNSLAKLHNRIRKIKVKQQTCLICNEQKKLQLASINHTYTENPEDYMWLCQSCHHLYDSSRGEKESLSEGDCVANDIRYPSHRDDSKPPEPTQSTFKPGKSDMLDAFLHAMPDYWKLDWWKTQIKIFIPGYDLVKREDLQRKIILPYERLLKYTTEDDTVALPQMKEDLKTFKEAYGIE